MARGGDSVDYVRSGEGADLSLVDHSSGTQDDSFGGRLGRQGRGGNSEQRREDAEGQSEQSRHRQPGMREKSQMMARHAARQGPILL